MGTRIAVFLSPAMAVKLGLGNPGMHGVELSAADLAPLSAAEREHLSRYACMNSAVVQPGNALNLSYPPTLEGVLAQVRDDLARIERAREAERAAAAERAARAEATLVAALAAPDEEWIGLNRHYNRGEWFSDPFVRAVPAKHCLTDAQRRDQRVIDRRAAVTAGETFAEVTRRCAEENGAVLKQLAALEAAAARQAAEREAEELKAQQDALVWITERGSPRLRKIVEAGFLPQSMPAYLDERLAVERPGWEWWADSEFSGGDEIRNPSEAALDAFAAAKATDPGVALEWDRPAHCAVLVSTFLGLRIVRAAEPPHDAEDADSDERDDDDHDE